MTRKTTRLWMDGEICEDQPLSFSSTDLAMEPDTNLNTDMDIPMTTWTTFLKFCGSPRSKLVQGAKSGGIPKTMLSGSTVLSRKKRNRASLIHVLGWRSNGRTWGQKIQKKCNILVLGFRDPISNASAMASAQQTQKSRRSGRNKRNDTTACFRATLEDALKIDRPPLSHWAQQRGRHLSDRSVRASVRLRYKSHLRDNMKCPLPPLHISIRDMGRQRARSTLT